MCNLYGNNQQQVTECSSIVTNPAAPGNYYAHARAIRTWFLLQAAPLKCALFQMWHHVPDSRDCPSRCANKTTCTCTSLRVVTKHYAHHCVQNCSRQAHQEFTRWTYGYRHTYIAAGTSAIQCTRWGESEWMNIFIKKKEEICRASVGRASYQENEGPWPA